MAATEAQAIADADIPVVLTDIEQRYVERGIERARSLWRSRVEVGKLDEADGDRKLALIAPTTSYDGFGDVEFVIEAVPERLELERSVFAELDGVTPSHAVLASNTSSLSITEMGLAATRPERMVGCHFFYPASEARLVEVTEGDDTAPETVQAALTFA